jgi:hypothetical protein
VLLYTLLSSHHLLNVLVQFANKAGIKKKINQSATSLFFLQMYSTRCNKCSKSVINNVARKLLTEVTVPKYTGRKDYSGKTASFGHHGMKSVVMLSLKRTVRTRTSET